MLDGGFLLFVCQSHLLRTGTAHSDQQWVSVNDHELRVYVFDQGLKKTIMSQSSLVKQCRVSAIFRVYDNSWCLLSLCIANFDNREEHQFLQSEFESIVSKPISLYCTAGNFIISKKRKKDIPGDLPR